MVSVADTNRSLYRNLIGLALPIMLNNMLHMLYDLADAFFLGRVSAAALSAPTISFSLIWFVVVFGPAFAMAGTTLIAQSVGKGDMARANFYAGQTAVIVAAMGVILGLTGFLLTPYLVELLRVPTDSRVYSMQYMRIVFGGTPFMFITFIHRAVLQGVGNSTKPLVIQIIAVGLNVILDPIFIFGWGPIPAMAVAGAAYATVIARVIAAVMATVMLFQGTKGIRLSRSTLRPNWPAMRMIAGIGLPNAVGQAVPAFGFTVLQGIVNSLGTAVVAAFGVGNRMVGLFNMPSIGFAQATTSVVGRCLGAKRQDLAVTAVKQSVLTVAAFIVGGMTLTFLFGGRFVRFFVDDPAVIAHGAHLFRILSPSVVLFALFTVMTGAFQGGGDTKPVMILNLVRLWGLRVPLAYVLAIGLAWGPPGVWWAMFISNLITGAAGFLWLARGRWLTKINPDHI